MELNLEHRMAAHCENGVISDMLRFYGIDLSEPMIFGLASGLFFSHMPFVKLSGMPVTSFRTFPGVFFKRVARQLDIKIETHRYLNKDHAMKQLDRVIASGNPVGCVVGMYFLPYLPIEYRFHFNGHNICISGKDEMTDEYTICDPNATEKVRLSTCDLVKVRFAKGGTYPLFGQMYWVKSVPNQLPDLKPIIVKAIIKNCKIMTSQPWVKFIGVSGIYYLSRRIRRWETTMGKRKADLNLAQVIRMLEEIGTGGAGFRFIYGAFLQEAATITGIESLNDYSRRITTIGDHWRKFARKASKVFRPRHGETYTYDQMGDVLLEIAREEESFYNDLYKMLKDAF